MVTSAWSVERSVNYGRGSNIYERVPSRCKSHTVTVAASKRVQNSGKQTGISRYNISRY